MRPQTSTTICEVAREDAVVDQQLGQQRLHQRKAGAEQRQPAPPASRRALRPHEAEQPAQRRPVVTPQRRHPQPPAPRLAEGDRLCQRHDAHRSVGHPGGRRRPCGLCRSTRARARGLRGRAGDDAAPARCRRGAVGAGGALPRAARLRARACGPGRLRAAASELERRYDGRQPRMGGRARCLRSRPARRRGGRRRSGLRSRRCATCDGSTAHGMRRRGARASWSRRGGDERPGGAGTGRRRSHSPRAGAAWRHAPARR